MSENSGTPKPPEIESPFLANLPSTQQKFTLKRKAIASPPQYITERRRCLIAWLNGKWLKRNERAAAIEELKAFIAQQLANEETLEDDEWLELDAISAELERLERVHRCELDTLAFAVEYFGEASNPDNAGNWDGFNIADPREAATFHREINEIISEVSHTKKNAKTAVAAPRSHAKSTYLSKGFPVHEIVYRLRSYIIIISETPSVSGPNLEWIANQLKFNEKLRKDFGPLLSENKQENPKDNSEEFIAWEVAGEKRRQIAKVQAASTGQALRGRNWNGKRPDLIICDDLEDAKTNAATPEQRAKLREWFNSVVIPLGDPKGEKTAIVYMGTTVHFDALLMQILYRRSDFTTKVYRAIIEHPKNTALWDACQKIYQDFENPKRLEDAEAFYRDHYDEMNEGARVLWAESQTIWKLMRWKWDNGSKAFNTEYQNNPIDEENMIFNPAEFTYWNVLEPTKTFDQSRFVISMGVDFAMGKQRGDYSAIVTTATDRESGVKYVIDAYGARIKPDQFIEEVAKRVVRFTPDVIGAEAVAAQEFFVDTLKERLERTGYPAHARIKKIYQRSRKELRIEALLPDIESGKIRFNNSHAILLEQFERYGQGAHDDLPDALEIATSVSKRAKRKVLDKPSWA